jgi:hypothetical protein
MIWKDRKRKETKGNERKGVDDVRTSLVVLWPVLVLAWGPQLRLWDASYCRPVDSTVTAAH